MAEYTDGNVAYFPAYEIVNDELRDYRFYKADMLHPNEQAVEYIWERLVDVYSLPLPKNSARLEACERSSLPTILSIQMATNTKNLWSER